MAINKARKFSKSVQLTALGFSLTVGAAAASAATGEQATDTAARLAQLAQARAEGKLDIQYHGVGQVQKAPHAIEMQTTQFASQWQNSSSSKD